ncbi:MAG: hypothetical protein ISR62_03865 [Desulfobacteraceae bacterium]|nr:hypothetical protein [Desulfobacterales bacterium]MBL6967540.1 hypothetical protein [Desulfobacteraceae bacterium]
MDDFEREALWKDAREQAQIAGVNPDDPAFLRHAREAPRDLEFYDQLTYAITKVRAEIEGRDKPAAPVEGRITTVEDALDAAMETNRIG